MRVLYWLLLCESARDDPFRPQCVINYVEINLRERNCNLLETAACLGKKNAVNWFNGTFWGGWVYIKHECLLNQCIITSFASISLITQMRQITILSANLSFV